MMQLVMEGTRRLPRRFPGGGLGRPPSQRAIQQVSQQGGFSAGGENSLPPRTSSSSSFGFYPQQSSSSAPTGPSISSNQHSFSFPQPTYSKWQPDKVEVNSATSFSPSHPAPVEEDSYGSPLAPLISVEQESSASILTEEQFGADGSSSLWDSSPPNSLPIVFPSSPPSLSTSPSSSSSSSFPSIPSLFSSTSLPSPSPTANVEFSVEEATLQNTVSSSLEVDLTGVVSKDDLSKTPTESSNLQLGPIIQETASSQPSNPDPEIALAIKIVSPFVSPSEDTAGEEAGVPQQPSDPFPDQENPGKYFTNDLDLIEEVQKKPLFYQDTVQAHSTDCSLRKWLAVCRDFENQPADLFE